ncbi:c-type cytochrome [Pedobacter punctiformis]|nr:cytochrome c [Pedobacter sp. HCMS5-2]
MSNGKDIYVAKCQNCHGEAGEGLGELAPPLTDSTFLKNNKTRLACIIKNGLNEPITIHGKVYKEKMPAFPELADIDVAQVMVFITNSFGNKQGFVHYNEVSKHLQNCK